MLVADAADALLKKSYAIGGGSPRIVLNLWTVGQEAGLPKGRAGDAHEYLTARGLIRARGVGGYFSLTAAGIDAVELAAEPEARTKRSACRWAFLKLSYEVAGRSSRELLNMWDVGERLGWEPGVTADTYEYLAEKGLVRARALGGLFSVTPPAVELIERAVARPDSPTSMGPPLSALHLHIANSFNDSTLVNTIIGSPGAAVTSGAVTIVHDPQRAAALSALATIRAHMERARLSPDQRAEVEQHLGALEEQLRKSTCSPSVLRALWRSLQEFAGGTMKAAAVRAAASTIERFIGL